MVSLSDLYNGTPSDVTGPSSSTDRAIAIFNGISGKVIQNSPIEISSTGVLTAVSTLGSELVTNGTFTGNATGWTLDAGWAYDSNNISNDGSGNSAYQDLTGVLNTGQAYQLSFDLTVTSGEIVIYFDGLYVGELGDTGSYIFTTVSTQSATPVLSFYSNSFIGSIDNVSLKEISKTIEISSSDPDSVLSISSVGIRNTDSLFLTAHNNIFLNSTYANMRISSLDNSWIWTINNFDITTEGGLNITGLNNISIETSGGERMYITSSSVKCNHLAGTGNRTVYSDGNGYFTNTSSDENLKTDIIPCEYGLTEVLQMNPIKFKWAQPAIMGEQEEIGFTAQSIQELVPEVVGMNYDGTLSLDYPKLIAVLVNAIKELYYEIHGFS